MPKLEIVSHAESQTEALAKKLAASFMPGDVLILKGELGSGKTTFVRALVAARGIDEHLVSSPSYSFVNEYGGEPPLFHLDLYRIADTSELTEIGWEDYLAREGIMMVEWGERAEELLPSRYYLIEFMIVDDDERTINISLVTA
ncbi:MAG: tRNA (adenosine(37)-N6)-threonylcarbamoyltransferase complex ATPase subunit type 1 TsaE [candidate division Zixibacteria bacterium]|nr:tRNA (adenosine(37)-N6)-threonylcarbamoyltransferase complex ATPase subunit type 1 TsaE [candidate division Zixibacteria bacterium]